MEKIKCGHHGCGGMAWIAGWLFTIGFLKLVFFWKGVWALLLWPYYLGIAFSILPQ